MNSKEETIARYLPEYFEGKDEERRNEFLSKPLARQYAAIMAWKYRRASKGARRNAGSSRSNTGLTAAEVMKHIRSLPELIGMIEKLSDADIETMLAGLADAADAVRNYHRNRQAQEIAELERKMDVLQQRINKLKSQL